jgi:hypothetical protein
MQHLCWNSGRNDDCHRRDTLDTHGGRWYRRSRSIKLHQWPLRVGRWSYAFDRWLWRRGSGRYRQHNRFDGSLRRGDSLFFVIYATKTGRHSPVVTIEANTLREPRCRTAVTISHFLLSLRQFRRIYLLISDVWVDKSDFTDSI